MRKPLCIKCQTQFRVVETGVTVMTMFSTPPRPCELIMADLLECPGCGTQIVAQYANRIYARHYNPNFQERLDQAKHVVYDYELPQFLCPNYCVKA